MAFSRVRMARTRTMIQIPNPKSPLEFQAFFVSFILAALPFSSRRKYSLARRTRAERTRSTFAIVGEWSGKIRSTPCPNETLRTVNDERAPPRCSPITIPSKIWMRSLSPSRTLTWTRTVSPDFIAGRSASCDFSTSSIALIVSSPASCTAKSQVTRKWASHLFTYLPRATCYLLLSVLDFLQQRAIVIIERRVVQQLRPPLERSRQRRLPAPPANVRVVPRQQHVRHLQPGEFGRPGVVRIIEHATGQRLPLHRLFIADHTGNQPADGVDDDQRRQFPAAQHVVADGQFVGRDQLPHALVHPLVSAAQQHDMREPAHPRRFGLPERPTLRRQQYHRVGRPALRTDVLDRARQRLRLHDHPRPAAVRHVVHAAVPIGRVIAQIVHGQVDQPAHDSAADHALCQSREHHPRKNRDDVELDDDPFLFSSSNPSGGSIRMRRPSTSTSTQICWANGMSTSPCAPRTVRRLPPAPPSTRLTSPMSKPSTVSTAHPTS